MASRGEDASQSTIRDTFRTLIFALLAAALIRSCAFEPFRIPSSSMEPTLLVGDFLFVSKYSYGYSRYSFPLSLPWFSGRIFAAEPRRGDVVVFRLPGDSSLDYIKRIIALPGDKVRVVDGVVYLNGAALALESLPPVDSGIDDAQRVYRETLPDGRSYVIFHDFDVAAPSSAGDLAGDSPQYLVPEGHYFVMGDNRENSRDSRFRDVGFIPAQNLIGEAQVIFFSLSPPARFWQLWQWPGHIRARRLLSEIR